MAASDRETAVERMLRLTAPASRRPKPYVGDARAEGKAGDFRRVVFTSPRSQLTVMTLRPGEDIGSEVHKDADQLFVLLKGSGMAMLDGVASKISGPALLAVPQGAQHNVVNTGKVPMRLVTFYSPPKHAPGTVHHTKAEALTEHE